MTDLFTQDASTTGIDDNTNTDFLNTLVGEDKKFKTVQDLAKGKAEADAFIARLQQENEGLRGELKTRTNLDDALDRILKSSPVNAQDTNQNNQTGENDADRTALTPEKIAQLIEDKVSERERVAQAQANLKTVKQRLAEAFGPSYVTRLDDAAKELGLSKEQINGMAMSQPQVLLRLVGVDKPSSVQRNEADNLFSPPASGTRTGLNQSAVERTQRYYNELKQRNAAEYWKPSTQNQMHKDALRLGEKFFT